MQGGARRSRRRTSFHALALIACCAWLVPATSSQALRLQPARVPAHADSGTLNNSSPSERVVFQHVVSAGPDAAWVQVRFAEATLPEGGHVRLTSLLDGDTQPLTGTQLVDEWNLHSAYFNGPAVLVELVAGPFSAGNRLVVDSVLTADPHTSPAVGPGDTICGATDDRVPSSDPAVGRLLFSGDVCSAFIVSDVVSGNERFHLTGGHCLFGSTNIVLQFDVPLSGVFCELNMPPAAKQFSVDEATMLWSLGTGDDWGVFRCFPNPGTGKTTFEEQGAAYPRAPSIPASGAVTVTGHGSDAAEGQTAGGNGNCGCDPKTFSGTWNTIQQTDSGEITGVNGDLVGYDADTCGGSSGSPVIHDLTGQAIAIHFDGLCTTPSNQNIGTAVTHKEIEAAIALFGAGPVWQDWENGLPGILGVPNLWGDGTLLGGDPVSLQLFGTQPNSLVTLVIGFTFIFAPFKGGTMVPNPDVLILGLQTDANGVLVLSATWPHGLPSDFETWYQAWIVDPTGPQGLIASDALLGTTP
ncbi:MAG: trypsin-like serine peptidase [Planctomycetota bacterium]|jgi:hypothetical protein